MSCPDAALVEFQLCASAVSGGAPHLVKRVSGFVETALDVQVCSPISADDAAKIDEPVRVWEIFILNLDWVSVRGVQCHNFSLPAANVKAELLRKDVESSVLLLDV